MVPVEDEYTKVKRLKFVRGKSGGGGLSCFSSISRAARKHKHTHTHRAHRSKQTARAALQLAAKLCNNRRNRVLRMFEWWRFIAQHLAVVNTAHYEHEVARGVECSDRIMRHWYRRQLHGEPGGLLSNLSTSFEIIKQVTSLDA